MKFSSFLSGLAAYVVAQSVICWLLGLSGWTLLALDLAAIVLAQGIYLVVIVAMVRAETARRADETRTAAKRAGLEKCDPFHP